MPYVTPYTASDDAEDQRYLDDEQAERLALLTREEGRSQAEILRQAVAAYRDAILDALASEPGRPPPHDGRERLPPRTALRLCRPPCVPQRPATGRFSVVSLERGDNATVLDLEARYGDLNLDLADCALVILAARHGTTRILSFDERHLRAVTPLQGDAFTVLPADA